MVTAKEKVKEALTKALQALEEYRAIDAKDHIVTALTEIDFVEWEKNDWDVFSGKDAYRMSNEQLLKEFGW